MIRRFLSVNAASRSPGASSSVTINTSPTASEVHATNRNRTHGNFIDVTRVRLQGGTGGAGMTHFGREPFKMIAPADGGDGGRGAHVWIQIVPAGRDLRNLKNRYGGEAGGGGRPVRCRGSTGVDLVVDVPKGTVIREFMPIIAPKEWNLSRLSSSSSDILPGDGGDDVVNSDIGVDKPPHKPVYIDTSHPFMPVGSKFLVCYGGSGGFGNYHFMSSTNRSPTESTQGSTGQIRYLLMEMKTIADIGLVGLPNAGKSSFIRAVSQCKTQVGDWAFTTLHPHLATVNFAPFRDTSSSASSISNSQSVVKGASNIVNVGGANNGIVYPPFSLTLADIPGIIRGAASENRGLGHAFLRHIERSRLLAYVIDLSRPCPEEDLDMLIDELETYKHDMALGKRGLIIANKADMLVDGSTDRVRGNLQRLEKHLTTRNLEGWQVIPISSKYEKNVGKVLWKMREIVEEMRATENREFNDYVQKQMDEYGEVVDFPWISPEYVSGVHEVKVQPEHLKLRKL
eukprot:Partr_v1_DN28410_c0_g3_i1_m42099 putative GTP-binding protein